MEDSDSDESAGALVVDLSASTDDDNSREVATAANGTEEGKSPSAFNCELCSYGTETSRNLRRHVLRNHTGRQYRCAQCGSQFNRRDYVTTHQRKSARCQGCEVEDISEQLVRAGAEPQYRPSSSEATKPPVPSLAILPPRVQRYTAVRAAGIGNAAASTGRFAAYRFEPGWTVRSRFSPLAAGCRSELRIQLSPLRLPAPKPQMVDASTMTGTASLRALVMDSLRRLKMGVKMPLPFDEVPRLLLPLNVVEEPQPDQEVEVVPAGAALPLDPGLSDEEDDIGHRREPE